MVTSMIDIHSGYNKTSICICVSPALQHYDESFSSLLFGYRAMMIRVEATKNEDLYYKVLSTATHKIVDRSDVSLLNVSRVDGLFIHDGELT